MVKEGHKSFPSGHTSCKWLSLGFLRHERDPKKLVNVTCRVVCWSRISSLVLIWENQSV